MGFAEGSSRNIHHRMLCSLENLSLRRCRGGRMENTVFSHGEMKLKYCTARDGGDTTEESVLTQQRVRQ